MDHPTLAQLEAGLDYIRESPRDRGTVELIVRRPAIEEREVLEEGELHPDAGVVGDTWSIRGSRSTEDGSSDRDKQVTLMNARTIALLARDPGRWPLAGDQLYVDLDLSERNLPPGTRLALGSAVIEVTAKPHRGCAKFQARFGADALRFVNSEVGRALRLRGLNATIVQEGTVRRGDVIERV